MTTARGALLWTGAALLAAAVARDDAPAAVAAGLLLAASLLAGAEPDEEPGRRDLAAPAVLLVGLAAALAAKRSTPLAVAVLSSLAPVSAALLAREAHRLALAAGGRIVAGRMDLLRLRRADAAAALAGARRREENLRNGLDHLGSLREVVREVGFARRVAETVEAVGRVARGALGAGGGGLRVEGTGAPTTHAIGSPDAAGVAVPREVAETDWEAARADGLDRIRRDGTRRIGRALGGRPGGAVVLDIPSGAPFAEDAVRVLASIAGLALERAALLEEIEARSRSDALTGLMNRRRFDERLAEEWERAARRGAPLSALMLDVDRFKLFNDRFGHPAGDAVLREVAAALLRTLRDVDVVARYGGEEFVALLPETDLAGAAISAERIRTAIAAARVEAPGTAEPLAVTASIGAAANAGAADSSALLAAADAALYRAKGEGRNRVVTAA